MSAEPNPASQTVEHAASNAPGCPASPTLACVSFTGSCTYSVPCQSGSVMLEFSCVTGQPTDPSCAHLDDYCPALRLLCDPHAATDAPKWRALDFTDERPECPWDRPAEGTECSNFWGQAICGYWCDRSSAKNWTVATCAPLDGASVASGPGRWKYDPSCGCS